VLAARPGDFHAISLGGFSQAKSQGKFALRAVARAGVDGLPVGDAARSDADFSAHAVAVRARTDGLNADGVVAAAADVTEKVSRAAIGGHQDIRRAIIIDIRVGGAPRHQAAREPELLSDFLKLVGALVVEHQREFSVGHLLLDARNVRLDVAVGYKYVFEAVQVVIEEKKAERKREQAGAAHR